MAVSIDRQMDRLRARKEELQRELAQLEKIEAELERTIEQALRTIGAAADGAVRGARTAVRAERRRGRPAGSTGTRKRSSSAGSGKRGRPKGSGKRQAQAVRIIKAAPGITTSEVAKKMGIGPNYLYRLLPDLAKDGAIAKQGKGWVPASGSGKSAAKPKAAAKKA